MRKSKIGMYLIIMCIVILILTIGYLVYCNTENKSEEYTPESEITEKQLRQTVINLYFMDIEKKIVKSELRKIDGKVLLENPYKIVVQMLIDGPENKKLTKVIPDETKINNVSLKNEILYIDFSKELIDGQELGREQEEIMIESIIKTLKQFNEVEKVKILVDGKEKMKFPDGEVFFDKIF